MYVAGKSGLGTQSILGTLIQTDTKLTITPCIFALDYSVHSNASYHPLVQL